MKGFSGISNTCVLDVVVVVVVVVVDVDQLQAGLHVYN